MAVSVEGLDDDNRYDGNICNKQGDTSEYLFLHNAFKTKALLSSIVIFNLYVMNFCTLLYYTAVYIEFLTEFGDLPLLRSDLTAIQNIDPYLATLNNGYIMNITEYQKGEFSPSARRVVCCGCCFVTF